ncbi:MAG TPA: hypothetical protein VI749_00550 [Candidatus Omnitrophota bacterium]|nr:hypothetical protein [Candidatus Omnitrophota bacterium]
MKTSEKPKWYFSTSSIVIGFLCVGPFILPLVWFNPRYSSSKKVILSIIILAISAALIKGAIVSFEKMSEYYKMLGGEY